MRAKLMWVLLWANLIVLGVDAVPAAGQGRDLLAFSTGVFAIDNKEIAPEFRLEYRMGRKFLLFSPIAGVMAATHGSAYGYAGINLEGAWGNRFAVIPNFAIGGYRRGNGPLLGGILEFRSGIEFAYRFSNASRLGVAVHHLSNARIYRRNPGLECVVLTYSMRLFGERTETPEK